MRGLIFCHDRENTATCNRTGTVEQHLTPTVHRINIEVWY